MEFRLNGATMELIHKYGALRSDPHMDCAAEGKETSITCDPWNPPCPQYDPSTDKSYPEWCKQRNALLKTSKATHVIIPDRTPKDVNSGFYEMYPHLLRILEKDSVRRFLRLYVVHPSCIAWGFTIIPEVLNRMTILDAVRCAKVVLEGKAPELGGFRANPNGMNKYGYFPLHEAAERFSVDMIKLLLHHGALTNLRTAAAASVIEGLLPLHVAVENTCMHKHLTENLTKKDANYVYKIIYLLCLLGMNIFLDMTRLLAEHTDNLDEEIWKYINDGKLLQTAVLLLSAQGHIRAGYSSCNRTGNSGVDGFSTIIDRLVKQIDTIKLGVGRDETEKFINSEAQGEHLYNTLLLVQIIFRAGKALDSYIHTHKEVPETNVLRRISQILNDHGFFPAGGIIRIGNLSPYEWWPVRKGEKIVETKAAAAETANADKKPARNRLCRRWERECTWNSYFPYWRSVLALRSPIKGVFSPCTN